MLETVNTSAYYLSQWQATELKLVNEIKMASRSVNTNFILLFGVNTVNLFWFYKARRNLS
jgi:hypothetical protein